MAEHVPVVCTQMNNKLRRNPGENPGDHLRGAVITREVKWNSEPFVAGGKHTTVERIRIFQSYPTLL